MENGLTFKTDPSFPGALAAAFRRADGVVLRNAVKIGKGGQAEAREALMAWARERGWND
jgi:hypothetical protein